MELTVAPSEPTRLQLRGGSAEIYRRAEEVEAGLWAASFGGSHKDFEYYRLIEETQRIGFSYRYLVLRDANRRALALQPLIVADQDLTASAGPTMRRVVELGRTVMPRLLQQRMLMAGCLVGDGKLGVAEPRDAQRAAELLAEALLVYAQAEKISLITLKDFHATARGELRAVETRGYTRLDGYPSLALDLDFQSFDEYVEARLSKATRKTLRRKLRASANAQPTITLEVLQDCSEVIGEIYPLYLAVAQRSAVSFEVFTPEYFVEAGRRMPERHRYFVWRQDGKAVAFSFCTVWQDTIYDNDIGLDYAVAHERHLYYVSFRDIIEWALAHGFRRYCSAPFNYDAKLHLRLNLVPLDLYVRHTSSVANCVMRRVAPHFAPAKSDRVLREHARKLRA